MYAARRVLAERRDARLVKLARTILLKRFGAKRQIRGNVCSEAVLAERPDTGLINIAKGEIFKAVWSEATRNYGLAQQKTKRNFGARVA